MIPFCDALKYILDSAAVCFAVFKMFKVVLVYNTLYEEG